MKDLKPIIAEHPFLRGLKPQHLEAVARHAREIEFKAGQIIFRQSDAAYEFFLIQEGEVAVESYAPRAENVPLQTLRAGDVLGWSWLFPPFSWHFQARALAPTRAILIDGARLLVACESDAELGFKLMQRIAQLVINRLQSTRKALLKFRDADSLLPAEEITALRHEIPTGDTLEAALAEHPFLRGMSPEHLRIMADAAMQRDFAAGETIFTEGEIANRFYLIQHGKLLLEAPGSDSRAVPIQTIGDGDVLGWSWLFPPYYWHFSARAMTATRSIFLFGSRLRERCEEDHTFGYDLMKRVCQVIIQRLQATRKQLLAARQMRRETSREPVLQADTEVTVKARK